MIFYLFSTGWTKNSTNIPRSHHSYSTHYLHIYLHNIRTLSSAETRAVCQNVYGVPRALYRRQRIGYTMYIYTVHTQTYMLSLSLSLSLFLYRSGYVFVFLSLSFCLFLLLSLFISDKTFQYAHVYRVPFYALIFHEYPPQKSFGLVPKIPLRECQALPGKDGRFNVCFQS